MTEKLHGELEMMCPQCGEDWIVTEEERRRRAGKGLGPPKRCPDCQKETS